MSSRPVSFVQQAVDFRFFYVGGESRYRNSIFSNVASVAIPILRAIAASFVIPAAATAGAIWHGGKMVRHIPGIVRGHAQSKQKFDQNAKVLLEDLNYARTIFVASSLTVFGFVIALPLAATKAISENITGRPFKPHFVHFIEKCATLSLIDMQLEHIKQSRDFRSAIQDEEGIDWASSSAFIRSLLQELQLRNGFRNAAAIANLAIYNRADLIGTWSISTTRDDLANKPEKIIDDIARGLYTQNPKLNRLTVSFGREGADDAGGPSREFVSQLFSSLAKRALTKKSEEYTFITESGASLPTCHASSNETKYRFATEREVDAFTEAELRECLHLAFGGVIPHSYQQNGKINAQKVRDTYEVIRKNIAPLTAKEQAGYEVLGAFLSYSQRRLNYPIGQIFSPNFFEVLAGFSWSELNLPFTALGELTLSCVYKIRQKESPVFQKAYQLLYRKPDQLKAEGMWKEELFYYVYPVEEDFPDYLMTKGKPDLAKLEENFELFQASIREKLYREALTDKTLPAIHAIGMGMAKGYKNIDRWQEVCQLSGEQLSKQIQGELRKEMLMSKVVSQDQRIKGYMRQWIQNAPQKQLVDLVKAATGSTTIGSNQVLLLQPHNNLESLCVFHTCVGQIDVPRYATYEIFKSKLEKSIEHALVSGFTLA